MDLRLLGPVSLVVASGPVVIRSNRQRLLIAALALDPAVPVSVDQLLDRLWDGAGSTGSRATLYTYVARLRRILDPVQGGRPAILVTDPLGYRLDVDPDAVDVVRFRKLAREARGLRAQDPAAANMMLHRALDEWNGEALADVTGEWADRIRRGLAEQRMGVLVQWAHGRIDMGDPDTVVDELSPVVAEHPLAEPLTAVFIRALHSGGRTAQALAAYATARQHVLEQLGAEPGRLLRDAHAAVLDGDNVSRATGPSRGSDAGVAAGATRPAPPSALGPTADRAAPRGEPVAATPAPDTGGRPAPAQLPPAGGVFQGRRAELTRLTDLLARPATDPHATGDAPIGIVSGTAGVGKSAIALRWAHSVRGRFPDGQLYVDLRGYHQEQPMDPGDALAGFLRALGMPTRAIPDNTQERAAAFRTLVDSRRLLVVLDNAASPEQVRPLLPGVPACVVVVTSRDTLSGLVARDGARRLHLDLLPMADCLDLLTALIGERVQQDPEAALELARQCARLPLALRAVAELAGGTPPTKLSHLVAELSDVSRRLDLLDVGGDPHSALEAVFSWSHRHLPDSCATMFGLLALHAGPRIDAESAATLAEIDVRAAGRCLRRLARSSLLEEQAEAGWYLMHDLLRAYAARAAGSAGPGPQQHGAEAIAVHDHARRSDDVPRRETEFLAS